MDAIFKAWKTSRALLSGFFEKYSLEQLNTIPEGFSNNLIWNIGHIIVAQQSLVYKGCGLEPNISDELTQQFKPGTKPERDLDQQEVEELKDLLTRVIDQTIQDYEKGIFQNHKERTTGTGFHLATVEDAFLFNNYHEGLHLGVMMGIRKFL